MKAFNRPLRVVAVLALLYIRRIALLAVVTLATFLQGSAAGPAVQSTAQAETRSTPERFTADTPRVTPGGATFTVPTGWSIATGKSLVILEPPETGTHIAIVDSQAADATAAVAAAWAAYKPDVKRPLKLVTPRPGRQGWDERQVFDYETSPNERRGAGSGAASGQQLDGRDSGRDRADV